MNEEIEMARSMPARYRAYTVRDLSGDKSFNPAREYRAKMKEYVDCGVGLLLSGPNGVGKTGFLAVLHREVSDMNPSWGSNHRMWCRARDIATTYGYGKTDKTFDEPVDVLYERAKWLVIDELGREGDVKNFERRMHSLVQKRFDAGKVTLFSTNLSLLPGAGEPGTVRTVYGEGFWSLLHEACMMVPVNGSDRRMA